jgi:hypothetical protein
MLVRPLLQGVFLSDRWAEILAKHLTGGRMAQERELLPSVLAMYDIKIDDLKLSDGSTLWNALVTEIVQKRNDIMHDGDKATPDEAKLALECARTLREQVVARRGIGSLRPECLPKTCRYGASGTFPPCR